MKKLKLLLLTLLTIFIVSCNSPINKSTETKNEDVKTEKPTITKEQLEKDTKNAVETQYAFTQVYKSTHESIVNISTKTTTTVNSYNPLEELLFGRSGGVEKRESGSLGSGFVVSADGYIVTNNHVIDGADEIYVKFSNGKEYKTKLVGTSEEVDIAVLKIESTDTFKPLEFADSDKIEIGQWSIAFGNPMGLNDSMTVGIVSAAGRSSLGIEEIENFIQTDAAINQGNSGGPLIDITGKVIGVNTAIYSTTGGSVGLGFAIPSNLVVAVKDSLITNGSFERPYLGVYLDNLTSEHIEKLKLSSKNGVLLVKIVENSPASRAGLQENDVIVGVNNKKVSSAGALVGELAAKKVGQSVTLNIIRNSQEISIPVVLEKAPEVQQQNR